MDRAAAPGSPSQVKTLQQLERDHIVDTLRRHGRAGERCERGRSPARTLTPKRWTRGCENWAFNACFNKRTRQGWLPRLAKLATIHRSLPAA